MVLDTSGRGRLVDDKSSWESANLEDTVSLFCDYLEFLSNENTELLENVETIRSVAREAREGMAPEVLARLAYIVAGAVESLDPGAVLYRCPRCGNNLPAQDSVCTCVLSRPGDLPRVVCLERPTKIRISLPELEELRFAQIRPRRDWPAVFSCNRHRDLWLFITYGWTPYGLRREFRVPVLEGDGSQDVRQA